MNDLSVELTLAVPLQSTLECFPTCKSSSHRAVCSVSPNSRMHCPNAGDHRTAKVSTERHEGTTLDRTSVKEIESCTQGEDVPLKWEILTLLGLNTTSCCSAYRSRRHMWGRAGTTLGRPWINPVPRVDSAVIVVELLKTIT